MSSSRTAGPHSPRGRPDRATRAGSSGPRRAARRPSTHRCANATPAASRRSARHDRDAGRRGSPATAASPRRAPDRARPDRGIGQRDGPGFDLCDAGSPGPSRPPHASPGSAARTTRASGRRRRPRPRRPSRAPRRSRRPRRRDACPPPRGTCTGSSRTGDRARLFPDTRGTARGNRCSRPPRAGAAASATARILAPSLCPNGISSFSRRRPVLRELELLARGACARPEAHTLLEVASPQLRVIHGCERTTLARSPAEIACPIATLQSSP